MTFPIDIKEKIDSDFGDRATEAYKILEEATSKTGYLNNSRIIRCIIFLANKDIEKLKKNIAAAIFDPRDIMLWAEYKNIENRPKRIRDFNKTFNLSENGVQE